MPYNPFNSSDGSSLEQGNPISDTTKKVVSSVTSQTAQQVKAAKQSFVDQLYGNVAPSTDESDPNGEAGAQQMNPMQKMQAQSGQAGNAASPSDQGKLDETRMKLQALQGQHKKSYFDTTFGEEAQQRRQQAEEQERQMKAQEEQDEEERKAQEKEQMDQEAQSFMAKGKGNGRNRMSQPLSVMQAKTKTEINRGATG